MGAEGAGVSRLVFRWVFLSATVGLLVLEFLAGLDSNENTEAWTEHIVRWLPDEVTYAAIAGLCVWLVLHFRKAYRQRSR